MGLRNGRRPDHKVNIGVGKDNINDFARKYNLEIEDIYEALNQDTAKKIVFYNTSDYWSAVTGGYKLSIPHNGNIVFAVYRTDSPTESTQVLTGVSMDSTNVNVESVDKFSGYLLCATLKDGVKSMNISEDGTHWDAEGLPIRNTNDPPSDDEDVVNKRYVDELINDYLEEHPEIVLGTATYKGQREIAEALNGISLALLPHDVLMFDNVAEMKASHKLLPGTAAITKGYYAPNDGGAGFYNIRVSLSDEEDGGSIILLDNGNVAELITDGTVNVKQFGAKGDGVTNDYPALNAMYQSIKESGLFVIVPKGLYMVSQTLDITVPTIMSERAYFKASAVMDYVCILRKYYVDIVNDSTWHQNVEYRINANGNNVAQYGIGIGFIKQSYLGLQARDCTVAGIDCGYVKSGNNENLFNLYAKNCPIGIYLQGADNVYGELVTIDCPVGISVRGEDCHINSIHSWLNDETLYPGSVVLECGTANCRVSVNWMCHDSMQYATKLNYDSNITIGHIFSLITDHDNPSDNPQLFTYDNINYSILHIGTLTIQNNGTTLKDVAMPFDAYDRRVALSIDNLKSLTYSNMDILPVGGHFKVTGQTTPASGTLMVECVNCYGTYIQYATGSNAAKTYKRSKNYWDANWSSWYEFTGTQVV